MDDPKVKWSVMDAQNVQKSFIIVFVLWTQTPTEGGHHFILLCNPS